MADAPDNDGFAIHPIADHVGRDRHQLAPIAGNRAAPVRGDGQAAAGLDQTAGHALGRTGIKLVDVGADQTDVFESFARPDFASHSGGIGVSSGVPHRPSQAATSAWSTILPAA